MAYQENTTVASPDVLINNLASFLASAGWTVEGNALAGSNRTLTVRKSGVTDYVHIYNTDATYVRMRISIGYNPALGPSAQANASGENRTYLLAGPYPKSFFFASQDQVWVAVGIAASGEYRHFTFGRLDKAGVYTGGTYIDGTAWPNHTNVPSQRWATWSQNTWPFTSQYTGSSSAFNNSGYIRADIPDDGKVNSYHYLGGWWSEGQAGGPQTALGEMGDTGRGARLSQFADDNAFSGRSILHTIPIFVGRTGSALYYSPAGTVQDVRIVSLQKFEAEQEIAVGADTWKVFPIIAKRPMNDAGGTQPGASGNYGYAIKKVL